MSREEKREEMLTIVEQWQESGMTQKDYAREHDIKLSKLRYWIRKHREEMDPDGFIPLSLPGDTAIRLLYPNGIELQLPGQTPPKVVRYFLEL